MFDDLQGDFSSYTHQIADKQSEHNGPRPLAMFLVVFAAWVVFATIFLLVSLPRIRVTLQETNAIAIWENRREYKKMSDTVQVPLYFVNGAGSSPVLKESITLVKMTGESKFHDCVEGLLKGPSDDALKDGSISLIAKGTKLIGLSVSGSTAFVDFSSEFLSSGQQWGPVGLEYAKAQVSKTIKAADSSIRDVVFLVQGSEI